MTKNFLVYKSGAGSGKTFTLVKEFLRLSLSDPNKIHFNFKRILAVTFTNKAAAEMKERVLKYLEEICHSQELPEIGKILTRDLNINEPELKLRSTELLTHILHSYSELSIGTIDSFTHKIVKTFAYELDLPVNFNIETDINSFYNLIIAELFASIGSDPKTTELLKDYALSKATDNSSWDPERSIKKFVKLLEQENATEYLNQIKDISEMELDELAAQIESSVLTFRNDLKEIALKTKDFLKSKNISTEDLIGKSRSPLNILDKCINGSLKDDDFEQKGLIKALESGEWLNTHKEYNINITRSIKDLGQYYSEHSGRVSLNRMLAKHMHLIRLIKKIEEISRNKKEEEQIVFISEFNRKIFELISNEPTPFIYERLGEKYHHYLLDEFQDTSTLQWQNILPLLDHSLSSGYYNLVVGDGKQSIYRWRNANVKQFINLPGDKNKATSSVEKERLDTLERNYRYDYLNVNRRSSSTIVEFNNKIFSALSDRLLNGEGKKIYHNQEQISSSDKIGYVEVHTGVINANEHNDLNLTEMLKQVKKALLDGFNAKDICIITRKKSHGTEAAQMLCSNSIPVVSSESLLLKNNSEVNVLFSFLKYLADRSDLISAGNVLHYLFEIDRIKSEELYRSFQQLNKTKDLFLVLDQLNINLQESNIRLTNLLDTCIRLCELFNLNQRNPIYVRFFLDQVTEFNVSGKNNLADFIKWWDIKKYKASVIIPETSNAVRIMTVHASKGLEFPVVIIPFCNWRLHEMEDKWVNLNGTGSKLPVSILPITSSLISCGLEEVFHNERSEEILDNLNLLYVAFTRASERLHILAYRKEGVTHDSVDKWIVDYFAQENASTEKRIMTYGEMISPSKINKKVLPELILPQLSFNIDSNTVRIKERRSVSLNTSGSKLEYGITIHEILSKIKHHEEVEIELENAVNNGLIKSDEKEILNKKIMQIIDHPLIKEYFTLSVNSKTETEILTAQGEVIRPDKVAILKDKTVIIDYKTGLYEPRKHVQQMESYKTALEDLGYKNIQKVLAFIDSGEVISLD